MNRPSLLSGRSPAGTEPATSRILADIEGRSSERATPIVAAGSRRPRAALLVTAGVLVLVVAGVGWWNRLPNAASPEAHVAAPARQPSAEAPPAPAGGGAMIVDAPPPTASTAPPAQHVAQASADTASSPGIASSSASVAINAPSRKPAEGALQAKIVAPRRAPQPNRSASGRKDEEDLTGTLLGIIKQTSPARARTQPKTMDELVAQIQTNPQSGKPAGGNVFSSLQNASTESGIQAQLRRCPSANTLQGIECRRKICMKMAGKDPACPSR